MAVHNDTGRWGEEVAVAYLKEHGYYVRDCRWRSGKRDIDIVALTPDETTIVFVEVKTRSADGLVAPETAVDSRKIRNLSMAANEYVKTFDIVLDLRFDIITVTGSSPQNCNVGHIEDAFNPLLIH